MGTATKRPYLVYRVETVRMTENYSEKVSRKYVGGTWATSAKKAEANMRFRCGAKYVREVIDGPGYTKTVHYQAEARV